MKIPKKSELSALELENLFGEHGLSKNEIRKLYIYIEALEELLDRTDEEDFFGTEGWRRYLDIE